MDKKMKRKCVTCKETFDIDLFFNEEGNRVLRTCKHCRDKKNKSSVKPQKKFTPITIDKPQEHKDKFDLVEQLLKKGKK